MDRRKILGGPSHADTREGAPAASPMLLPGLLVLLRGASWTSRSSVRRVGEVQVTATETQRVPPWMVGVAPVIGAALSDAGPRQEA